MLILDPVVVQVCVNVCVNAVLLGATCSRRGGYLLGTFNCTSPPYPALMPHYLAHVGQRWGGGPRSPERVHIRPSEAELYHGG